MSKLKKWTAVLLTAVMIGTLLGGSKGPAVAKAENEAAQSETADDTKKEAGEESSGETAESVSEADQEEAPGTVSQKDGTGEADQTPSDQTLVQQEQKEQEEEAASQESGAKTVGESQKEELKEAENRQESETSGKPVELKGISVKEDISLDQIATPETFTVQVDLEATEDFEVYYMELVYECKETGEGVYYQSPSDEVWNPAIDGGVYEIEVVLNKYAPEGEYTLACLTIHADTGNIWYENIEGTLMPSCNDPNIKVTGNYLYNGEVDYKVSESKTDLSLPRVTDVRLLSETPVQSGEEIKLAVDYSEEGSGVKSISVGYLEVDGYSEVTASASDLAEEQYTGNGTIEIATDEYAENKPGSYEINSIIIEDHAGNIRHYQRLGAEEGLASFDDEQNYTVIPEAWNLDIQNTRSNGLKVKDMRIEGASDKDNLAAGDSFDVVVTIYNDIEKTVPVRPEWCFIRWFDLYDWEEDGSMEVTSEGEMFTLAPGAQADLHFPVKISSYSETKTYILDHLSLNAKKNSGFTPCTWYNAGDNELLGYGSTADDPYNSGIMEVLPYNGQIDWAVTTPTSTPDNEAPIIESVTVNPSSLTIPGKLELEIRTSGEEVSPINSLRWTFLDKERENNAIMGMSTNPEEFKDDGDMYAYYKDYYYSPISYLEEKQCYITEVELDEKVIKGTYHLFEISLGDEAGNNIFYGYVNATGKLEGFQSDGSKVYLDTCEFTVPESAAPDEDFASPVFKDIELLENQTEAGEVIQCRIKVEDETGLSKVRLSYEYDSDQDGETDTFLSLESRNVILQGDEYICDFIVDPYCFSGNYDLYGIFLVDGSIRENFVNYMYDKIGNVVFDAYNIFQLPAGRDLSLSVTQPQEDMVVTELANENVTEVAEGMENGGTIVVKGSYLEEGSYYMFPAEFFEVAKEKKLTVIIPDSLGDSEIVVRGEDLETLPNMDPELRIQRESLVEDTAGVGDDNLYYPVNVVASDAALPITVRVKIEKNFLDQCGDNPIRISKVDESGTPAVIAENVTVGEDGYVEISFPNGLQGTGVASQMLYTNSGGQRLLQEKYSFMISSQKEEAEVKLGDVNGDGNINLIDLMQCLNHVGRKENLSGEALLAADINQDGDVNLVDLMRLLNFVGRKTDEL